MKEDDQFVLVAVKGKVHTPLKEGIVKFVQACRSQLKRSGNWKGWKLQVRRKAAYLAKPILEEKKIINF